jgi:hypothetical protein
LLTDAKLLGIELPEEEVTPKHYQLWPEHWPAVDLFMRCFTQWRTGPAGLMGLDYNVVIALAGIYQVADLPATLEELQVMELHARQQINDRIAKEQRR